MQALYREFGLTGKDLDSHAVELVASEIAGTDLLLMNGVTPLSRDNVCDKIDAGLNRLKLMHGFPVA